MKILRGLIVTIGATIFATVGINAFDNIDNFSNSLVGSIILSGQESKKCSNDMVFISTSDGGYCIDKYENSAGKACVYEDTRNKNETDDNLALSNCKPVSKKGALPWRYIARHQAELACSKAGKRLPTSKEWYRAALGTMDKKSGWGPNDCNVNKIGVDNPDATGLRELCVSSAGAYDMVGNVWEWIEETVYEGKYDNRPLPVEGYIESIDSKGMALETNTENADAGFFNDYFWIDRTDARGVFRGGYWGNQSDAGQYSANVTVPPSFVGKAVGFRCVKEVN